jgi:hypothetical protein
MQSANDSLAQSGGVIEVLPGYYPKLTGEPIIMTSNRLVYMPMAVIDQVDIPNFDREIVFQNSDFENGNTDITFEGGLIKGTAYMAMNFNNVTRLNIYKTEYDGLGQGFTVYGVDIKIWKGDDVTIDRTNHRNGRTAIYYSGTNRGRITNGNFKDYFYVGVEVSVEAGYDENEKFVVTGNLFDNCTSALLGLESLLINFDGNIFLDNEMRSIQLITSPGYGDSMYNRVTNNIIKGGRGWAINIVMSPWVATNDNTITEFFGNRSAVFYELSSYGQINSNLINQVANHGIEGNGTDIMYNSNQIWDPSYGNPDMYSGIVVSGLRPFITTNMIRNPSGYMWASVRIRSDCVDAIVDGNDLRLPGRHTITDEGTGTIIGDNWS